MLIKCPECQLNVSDKAIACPHCGYPISASTQPVKIVEAKTQQPRRKFRRLPNGFGSIKQLSGKRRRPFAAFPPTKEWNGKSPKSRKAIGYYETYNEAYKALTEYNKNPYDTDAPDVTFENVFQAFYDMKAETVSKSSLQSYKTASHYFVDLKKTPFREIKLKDMQNIIDGLPYGYATSNNCRNLLIYLYKYAISHDICTTNYAEHIVIKKENDIQRGVPFTEDELKRLWELRDDPDGKVINIMIYTGLRVGEVQGYTYKDGIIKGGIKSRAGRNRIVPVIDDIRPLVESFDNFVFVKRTFRNDVHVSRVFREADCLYAANGEKHTSHDCRHTFSWLADKFGMDDVSKHMIMGHSLGKDVEKTVYGHRTIDELITEMNKISVIKK